MEKNRGLDGISITAKEVFKRHVEWVLDQIPKEQRKKNITILSPTFTKDEEVLSKVHSNILAEMAQEVGFDINNINRGIQW